MSDLLQQLDAVLASRRQAAEGSRTAEGSDAAEGSYVASLHRKGLNKILEKVGEEATEVILAAKDVENGGDRQAMIAETADLWFHSLVMLSHLGADSQDVLDELARRFGLSGLEEKASRAQD